MYKTKLIGYKNVNETVLFLESLKTIQAKNSTYSLHNRTRIKINKLTMTLCLIHNVHKVRVKKKKENPSSPWTKLTEPVFSTLSRISDSATEGNHLSNVTHFVSSSQAPVFTSTVQAYLKWALITSGSNRCGTKALFLCSGWISLKYFLVKANPSFLQ